MLGAVLAFLSAGFFGLNNATVRRGVLKATVLQGMAITVPMGVPLFVVFAAVFGGFAALAAWPPATWGWMALAGVVHFVFGRYGNYRATQALGATLSTPIQQISILVSLVLAVVFLDEGVSVLNLAGIALVILGPMVVLRRREASRAKAKAKGFEPEYLPGFAWGAACALGYGASPLLIALGLDAARRAGSTRGLADSVAGVLVSYAAATAVVLALVALAGGRRYMAGLDRGAGGWFYLSTLFVALSQLFRYLALAIAPVTVVVPIQRLSVVFRILFNGILNADHEVMDRWVVLTILLSMVGVLLLTVDGHATLQWLGIPRGIAESLADPVF